MPAGQITSVFPLLLWAQEIENMKVNEGKSKVLKSARVSEILLNSPWRSLHEKAKFLETPLTIFQSFPRTG